MREHLYRGKRTDNGEWVEGDFTRPCNIVFDSIGYDKVLKWHNVRIWSDYEVRPETVGEYTGLTDKNGKKIFEGDIVRYKLGYVFTDDDGLENAKEIHEGIIGVVEFKNGEFTPRPMRIDISDYYYSYGYFDFEVLGNIYDNSELLEVRQ